MRIIDTLVVKWYSDKDTQEKIHDFLGMTLSEYDEFVNTNRIPSHLSHLAVEVTESPVRKTGLDRGNSG